MKKFYTITACNFDTGEVKIFTMWRKRKPTLFIKSFQTKNPDFDVIYSECLATKRARALIHEINEKLNEVTDLRTHAYRMMRLYEELFETMKIIDENRRSAK